MKITICGGEFEVTSVRDIGYSGVYELTLDDGTEWIVAPSSEVAGDAAMDYWRDMAEHDPKEFTCLVGEETLLAWALGRPAGPGNTKVRNLQEWLELWRNTPEEHWGSYDSTECDASICAELQEKLGYEGHEVVVYRHN